MTKIYEKPGQLKRLRGTPAGVYRFRASLFGVVYAVVVGGLLVLTVGKDKDLSRFQMKGGHPGFSPLWDIEPPSRSNADKLRDKDNA